MDIDNDAKQYGFEVWNQASFGVLAGLLAHDLVDCTAEEKAHMVGVLEKFLIWARERPWAPIFRDVSLEKLESIFRQVQ